MLTKAITYENYNGEKKTKNFYFHLTKSEIAKMSLYEDGGIEAKIKKMVESGNNAEIMRYFEDFVLSCYGEKSADGEEFVKNDEVRERFKNHPAYDVLFMEFIDGGAKAMSDFINGVIPASMAESVKNADPEALNKLVGFEVIPGKSSQDDDTKN